MSQLRIAALLLAIGLIAPAFATRIMHQPEDAYELSLGQVSLPERIGGAVIFKTCSECKTVSLRVSSDTRYFVGGQQITLADLGELTAKLARSTNVVVFFDKESKFVNRVAID